MHPFLRKSPPSPRASYPDHPAVRNGRASKPPQPGETRARPRKESTAAQWSVRGRRAHNERCSPAEESKSAGRPSASARARQEKSESARAGAGKQEQAAETRAREIRPAGRPVTAGPPADPRRPARSFSRESRLPDITKPNDCLAVMNAAAEDGLPLSRRLRAELSGNDLVIEKRRLYSFEIFLSCFWGLLKRCMELNSSHIWVELDIWYVSAVFTLLSV